MNLQPPEVDEETQRFMSDLKQQDTAATVKKLDTIKRKVGGIKLGDFGKKSIVEEEIILNHEKPIEVPKTEAVIAKAVQVEEEEAEVEENSELPPADPREHVNLVFIGHVDAGKSTLSGSILYAMGSVDERTIEKYKRDAKELNRDSWFLAFIMDQNEEERARGKTVEVGRAQFATEAKRYTMLDAPGHKNYVPAMIAGAAQADVGILVISARKGEFEAGFDRLGQTREHATLAKTLGVQKLVVVVNKMDESTVKWSKDRYEHCVKNLTPFLKQCGFKVKRQVVFMPISAITGANVKRSITKEECEWAAKINDGKSLLNILDDMALLGRDETAPLRIPVLDRYTDRGTNVMGKIEAGYVNKDQKVIIAPSNLKCTVDAVLAYVSTEDGELEQREVSGARVGENVIIKLKDVSEDDLMKGFVISSRVKPLKACYSFVAQLQLLELLPHRSLFTAGYQCVLHVHTAIEECTVLKLLKEMDMKTGKPNLSKVPRFVKSGSVVWCRIRAENLVCVEAFKDMMPLGRFTLRDEGKTIAIGKIIKADPVK